MLRPLANCILHGLIDMNVDACIILVLKGRAPVSVSVASLFILLKAYSGVMVTQ